MEGLGIIHLGVLAEAGRTVPAEPGRNLVPAWAMLGVLAVILTALLGLLLLTLVRQVLKRSVLPVVEIPPMEHPKTTAWEIAGQRARPAPDDGPDGDGGGDGGDGGD